MIQVKSKNKLVNWEIVSVNPNDKNWNWSDLFCFWAVSIQSIIGFSLISSLYLVYDLNFYVVFFGGIIASLLAFISFLASAIILPNSWEYSWYSVVPLGGGDEGSPFCFFTFSI